VAFFKALAEKRKQICHYHYRYYYHDHYYYDDYYNFYFNITVWKSKKKMSLEE